MMFSPKKYPVVNRQKVFRKFVSIFFPSVFSVLFLSLIINYYFFHIQKKVLTNEQERLISLVSENLTGEFESILSDLLILSSLNQIAYYNNTGNREALAQIEQTFLEYCTQKKMYDQIRLIDEKGMEKVRINFNNGKPFISARGELQNKQSRYYFKETIRLDNEQIFISPFDLNMEHHKIEKPIKPMMRFGTPVFDTAGQRKGIVLINYFGSRMLDYLKRQEEAAEGQLLLINENGYWLKGISPSEEWGFMYKNRRNDTFAKRFPNSGRELLVNESGQFENSEGLFSFQTIAPLSGKRFFKEETKNNIKCPENWKLIAWMSKSALAKAGSNLQRSLWILNGILFLLLGIISWRLAASVIRRKMAEQELLRKEKFEGVVEMAGAASHELNQPLQAAQTYAQILMAGMERDNPQFIKLQKLNKQIEKLGILTARLMHITRYETKTYAGGSKIIDIERASTKSDNSSRP